VIILDANEDVQSKRAFHRGMERSLQGLRRYQPDSGLVDVEVTTLTA
jgi:hypothetical protein